MREEEVYTASVGHSQADYGGGQAVRAASKAAHLIKQPLQHLTWGRLFREEQISRNSLGVLVVAGTLPNTLSPLPAVANPLETEKVVHQLVGMFKANQETDMDK